MEKLKSISVINKLIVFFSKTVGRKISFLSGVLIGISIIFVIIFIWISNTLHMVNNIDSALHTFSVSLLEGRIYSNQFLKEKNNKVQDVMYKKLNISHSYAMQFNQTYFQLQKEPFDIVVKNVDKVFFELDTEASKIFTNRISLIGWHPLVQNLLNIAGQAAKELDAYIMTLKKWNKETNPEKKAILTNQLETMGDGITELPMKFSEGLASLSDFITRVTKTASFVILFLMLFLGWLVTKVISKKITEPLKELKKSMMDISDLTKRVPVLSHDEVGDVSMSFNNFIEKLQEILRTVKENADIVTNIATELNSSAENMSSGANEQASTVEEIASALEQIGMTISNNAENALKTEKVAQNTSGLAADGNNTVHEAIKAVKIISDKINIIESIAAQTNLLAVNAAIEAARAGTHGKGFSVVASEVRDLSRESTVAAKEINELSQQSHELADLIGKLFSEIVPKINDTTKLVQDISIATSEQSKGVEQINLGMSQLNSVTQQNAGISEELASAAENLKQNVVELKDKVSFFTV